MDNLLFALLGAGLVLLGFYIAWKDRGGPNGTAGSW